MMQNINELSRLDLLKQRVKAVDSMKATIIDFNKMYVDDIAIRDGSVWYWSANSVAYNMAKRYGFSVAQVAGVLSTLSPSVLWTTNIHDTETMLSGYRQGFPVKKITVSTYGQFKDKCFRILEGKPETFSVEDQFTKDTKTHAFYWNILTPTGSTYVTVDRHAIGVALASHGNDHLKLRMTHNRYRNLSAAYVKAAHVLGYATPATLQATCWVAYRNNFGGRPTYTPTDVPF